MTIRGITHFEFNYANPSIVTFIDGGIGESFITINITSPRGEDIESTFIFYYTMNEYKPNDIYHLKNFLETIVDLD